MFLWHSLFKVVLYRSCTQGRRRRGGGVGGVRTPALLKTVGFDLPRLENEEAKIRCFSDFYGILG